MTPMNQPQPGADLSHLSERKLLVVELGERGFVLRFEDGIVLVAATAVTYHAADGATLHYNRFTWSEPTPAALEPMTALLHRKVALARWDAAGALVLEFYTGERLEID